MLGLRGHRRERRTPAMSGHLPWTIAVLGERSPPLAPLGSGLMDVPPH